MPISYLTGTESQRFEEIRDRWAVFSAPVSDKFIKNNLYSVPLGQTFAAEVLFESGSVLFTSGTVEVKKDIHVFELESEATSFINEIGEQNIASISERFRVEDGLTTKKITEVQLVNISEIDLMFELLNANNKLGYKVEVFSSGTFGLKEVQKYAEYNARDEIISDTFLKYFEIEEE